MPMDGCLGHLPRYDLRPDRLKAFSNGLLTHDRQFQMQHKPEENVILRVYCNDEFIGIGHFDVEKAAILPDKVIAR